MRTVRVELETITPLFLSGADQGIAELRAPSFRGALRYWLRALLGAEHADIERVYGEESKIFGNTSAGSAVTLRVSGQPQTQRWHPTTQRGIQYLLFSLRQRDPQTRQEIIRPSIPAGAQFSLTLQQAGRHAEDGALRRAAEALWLLCQLGGLGARGRRGAGSLAARQWLAGTTAPDQAPLTLPPAIEAATPVELQQALQAGLRAIRGRPYDPPSGDLPEFDILHPNFCRIIVVSPARPWRRWEDALEALGQNFKQFRFELIRDRKRVGTALRERAAELDMVERAAFGLPIVFFYRGAGQSALEGARHDRRASPLHMRITRLANNTYTVVLTCFKAAFLPEREGLELPQLNRRPPTMRIGQPDLAILDQYLDSLSTGVAPLGEPLEVAL